MATAISPTKARSAYPHLPSLLQTLLRGTTVPSAPSAGTDLRPAFRQRLSEPGGGGDPAPPMRRPTAREAGGTRQLVPEVGSIWLERVSGGMTSGEEGVGLLERWCGQWPSSFFGGSFWGGVDLSALCHRHARRSGRNRSGLDEWERSCWEGARNRS